MYSLRGDKPYLRGREYFSFGHIWFKSLEPHVVILVRLSVVVNCLLPDEAEANEKSQHTERHRENVG